MPKSREGMSAFLCTFLFVYLFVCFEIVNPHYGHFVNGCCELTSDIFVPFFPQYLSLLFESSLCTLGEVKWPLK